MGAHGDDEWWPSCRFSRSCSAQACPHDTVSGLCLSRCLDLETYPSLKLWSRDGLPFFCFSYCRTSAANMSWPGCRQPPTSTTQPRCNTSLEYCSSVTITAITNRIAGLRVSRKGYRQLHLVSQRDYTDLRFTFQQADAFGPFPITAQVASEDILYALRVY